MAEQHRRADRLLADDSPRAVHWLAKHLFGDRSRVADPDFPEVLGHLHVLE